jgi:hypothetical protein
LAIIITIGKVVKDKSTICYNMSIVKRAETEEEKLSEDLK